MKILSEIGLPLDGSATARRGLGCAVWIASRLEGRVHVLHIGAPLDAHTAVEKLGVPEKFRSLVAFHQATGDPAREILEAERRLGIDLIVMSARGAAGETAIPDPLKIVGHVAREVVEKSEAPVLLLPLGYREALPWHTAVVPLSGEIGTDESLTLALRLALPLDLRVSVVHVAATDEQPAAIGATRYSDQTHHEYPHRLNEFVSRACPMCSAAERERIEDFCLCHGDIARELLGLLENKRASLVVVGWHGRFVGDHAQVLKALVQKANCPILLVKAPPRQPFRLKVGEGV